MRRSFGVGAKQPLHPIPVRVVLNKEERFVTARLLKTVTRPAGPHSLDVGAPVLRRVRNIATRGPNSEVNPFSLERSGTAFVLVRRFRNRRSLTAATLPFLFNSRLPVAIRIGTHVR